MRIGKAIKRRLREVTVARVAVFAVFLLYAFVMVYALVWAALGSLKTHVEFVMNPNKLPERWLFGNYKEAFSLLTAGGNGLVSIIFNSLWLTFFQSLISVGVSCMAAYVMGKYGFVGKRVIAFVLLTVMMIPLYGSIPGL
jgi:ABC-type glycerol-3-phosphate transport system permease component